jgi:hypothetical protein
MAHSFTLASWLSFNLGGSTDKREREKKKIKQKFTNQIAAYDSLPLPSEVL